MDTIYLDLETTGLYPPDDEILEIAIVDDAGRALLHSLVRPVRHTDWPDAVRHRITPADVQHAPALDMLREQIIEAVQGKIVVIYNAPFDQGFLPDDLATAAQVHCCMRAFAEYYGEWDDWHGNYRWQSLSTAARFVRHVWTGPTHRAVADCVATRAVWRYLTEPEERQRVEAIKREEGLASEAAAHLRGWELEEQRTRQRFEARMTAWWHAWWLKRPPLEPLLPRAVSDYDPRSRARADAYAQVFTGYTMAVLEQVERAEALRLPCYRLKRDIPTHLKPDTFFRTHTEAWVRAALRERAYYVSRSGKSFWWLYDTRDVEEMLRRHVPRYQGQAVPSHLATATQLRRAGMPPSRLAILQPVAEYYHPIAHRWYPLYQQPQSSMGDEERHGGGETHASAAHHHCDP
jgi:DNA polymerase III epsilon subunit-like protein